MAILIGFEHQEYRCVYYDNINGLLASRISECILWKLKWFWKFCIGFEHHIMQIEMGFHCNSNWF